MIGEVHPQTAPARAVLEKEGFRYRNYVDIFDGGPTLECDIDRVRAIRKSRLVDRYPKASLRRVTGQLCLVANENYANFRVPCWCGPIEMSNRLVLIRLRAGLRCAATLTGDTLRLVRSPGP